MGRIQFSPGKWLLGGVGLTPKASVHSLGVVLDPGWWPWLGEYINSCPVCQVGPFQDKKIFASVTYALVMSRLDYYHAFCGAALGRHHGDCSWSRCRSSSIDGPKRMS